MLDITQIPVLTDNYVYLITCKQTGITAVVDPAVSAPVIDTLGDSSLNLILNTHHHPDHVGGNKTLKVRYGCTVVGASVDAHRIPGIDVKVDEGDTVEVGNAQAQVLFVPGHTSGHIAYYFAEDNALFCGDTLFAGGCGRLFEGTPEQMFNSLAKLAALPDKTRIFCAHEYTQSNLAFCKTADPDNAHLQDRIKQVTALRAAQKPTVPSTLKEEKQTNVFLRAATVDAFTALRQQKDTF